MNNWEYFKDYWKKMVCFFDCDPAYPAMNYICDRLELNIEQRYWMSFLYGCTYSAPAVYYIMNEFPDYENVNVKRLQKWWNKNKNKVVFQSDRAKVKNFNQFVPAFESYQKLIGGSQRDAFSKFFSIKDLKSRYDSVYEFTSDLWYFGRFSLFNYLECLSELTDLSMDASSLYLQEAESCRNGLCYACGRLDMVTLHHNLPKSPIDYNFLEEKLFQLYNELKVENPEIPVTYFNIETVLCAFKKLFWETRYLGYYIDRFFEELSVLNNNVSDGVEWSILWDFRKEFFNPFFLAEIRHYNGIRKERGKLFNRYGTFFGPFEKIPKTPEYRHKIKFPSIGDVYSVT